MSDNPEKKRTYPENFSRALEISALFIILSLIVFFAISYYRETPLNKYSEKIENIDSLDISLDKEIKTSDVRNITLLSAKVNKQIQNLNNLKQYLEECEKTKKDDMKYYSAIVGFILTIVGFFGFKSIFDSREIAIKNAADEARRTAKEETKKIAETESRDEANKVASKKAEEVVIKYLEDNHSELFRLSESTIVEKFEQRFNEINGKLEKALHPEAFNEHERPEIFNKINGHLQELAKQLREFKEQELKNAIIKEIESKK